MLHRIGEVEIGNFAFIFCYKIVDKINAFDEYCNIDGIVLTKLDGTAKGGVIIAIEKEYRLPVVFVGTGESVEDLEKFNPKDFVDNLY